LKVLYRIVVYSNLWVALSVAALSYLTLEKLERIPYAYLAFVFAATAFSYSYMRLIQVSDYRPLKGVSQKHWITGNRLLVFNYTLLQGVLAGWLFWRIFDPMLLWLLFWPALIAFLYPLSFRSIFSNFSSLRRMPGMKLFLIAGTWAYVTELVPSIHYIGLDTENVLEFIFRCLLVVGLTIPFDIRDYTVDSASMQTLPKRYGLQAARGVALLAIAVYQGWLLLKVAFFAMPPVNALVILTVFCVAMGLIFFATPNKKESYYSFWLEGVPILAAALSLATSLVTA